MSTQVGILKTQPLPNKPAAPDMGILDVIDGVLRGLLLRELEVKFERRIGISHEEEKPGGIHPHFPHDLR